MASTKLHSGGLVTVRTLLLLLPEAPDKEDGAGDGVAHACTVDESSYMMNVLIV